MSQELSPNIRGCPRVCTGMCPAGGVHELPTGVDGLSAIVHRYPRVGSLGSAWLSMGTLRMSTNCPRMSLGLQRCPRVSTVALGYPWNIYGCLRMSTTDIHGCQQLSTVRCRWISTVVHGRVQSCQWTVHGCPPSPRMSTDQVSTICGRVTTGCPQISSNVYGGVHGLSTVVDGRFRNAHGGYAEWVFTDVLVCPRSPSVGCNKLPTMNMHELSTNCPRRTSTGVRGCPCFLSTDAQRGVR